MNDITYPDSYAIAEARNQFTALIRRAEETHQPVQVTRRGQPVAVILSAQEYDKLLENQPKRNFWDAYLEYVEKWKDVEMDIDPDDIWADVRDRTPAPDTNPWL